METTGFLTLLVGAFLALAGGCIQIVISNIITAKKEDKKLKKELLQEFMTNRMGLGKNNYSQQFKVPFMISLNKIYIVFSNDKNVIKILDEINNAMKNGEDVHDEIYELTKSMFINLKLTPPSKENFFKYITFLS
ncbi:hypothetical protein V701_02772 [Staphylococcus aureus M67957]|uniref:DUF6680 family protein n=4 Tax=Staphylococcus aureus TaxID=1280 RepID=UPI00044F60D0|nr:DUF6680 family protein [Staphylococcus aureus]EUQ15787.1 hypothetical protein T908_02686 [Staphylococcus aureus KINB6009]EVD72289.1 hypothetical protein T746_02741 [Staphylococcus aureus LAMC0050]EVD93793.1 hypothetical protein T754_02708 [Staphylococcus aureus HOAG6084]EVX09214.1 hypothetical protein U258_02779 [Staphylococcus aureus H27761]EWT48271.1 hypothetical protein V270_02335 [Staphylococcus aureus M39274]